MMIISTFNLFYLLAPLFIWVEFFGFFNRKKVYKRLDLNDFDKSSLRLYLFFLFSKLFYLIWMPLGLFTDFWVYFLVLLSLGFFKFLVLLTKNNIIINLYDFLNPLFSSIILIFILFQVIFQ